MRSLAIAIAMGVCTRLFAAGEPCVRLLEKSPPPVIASEAQALSLIGDNLPRIIPQKDLDTREWFQLLQHFALPNVTAPSPLLVTSIIGGGNSGKSTLMNALPGLLNGDLKLELTQPVSRTGWFAGMTRQMLVAVPSDNPEYRADLRRRFGNLNSWSSPAETLEEGEGLIIQRGGLPGNLAFVDSPDFDTGQALRDDPDNLRAALRVIRPSDALIVLFGPQTYRNQAAVQRLARIFRLYGQKRTILIFWGDSSMPEAEVNQYLRGVAEAIFGSTGGVYPDAVLGAYFMPYSGEVAKGEKHPALVPLASFHSFPALIKYLSIDSLAIKNYSLQNASDTIVSEVSAAVRDAVKSRIARRLYVKALLALSEDVAETSLENFPYDSMREAIRHRYGQLTSDWQNGLQQLANLTAVPEEQLPALFAQIRGKRIDPVIRKGLEQDHRWHDRVAVAQYIMELRGLKIAVGGKRPAAKDFLAMARRYAETFPEEKLQVTESGAGRFAVELPPAQLLNPQARAVLKELFRADTDRLTRQLSERLDQAQFSETTTAQIGEILSRIRRGESFARRAGRTSLQLMTLAAPVAAGFGVHYAGFDSTLMYLLVGNIAARPFHFLNAVSTDKFLRTKLNEWFHGLQKSVTIEFLDASLSQPLLAALNDEDSGQVQALQNVQEALRFLNPKYARLPLNL